MSDPKLIQQFVVDAYAEEGITQALLDYVDLDVAHSPVIALRGEGEDQAVQAIKTLGGRYIVRHPMCPQSVSASELKIMRLRYLLAVKQRQRRQWAADTSRG